MKKRVPFLLVVVLLTFLAEPAQAGAIKNVKFSFSTNDGIPLAKIPIQILSSNGQSNLSVDKVLSANGSATSPVYSTGVRVRIRETASIPGTSLG
ncbi:MAG: hypothetical protein RL410_1028, partial [Actinomycetota bacterium]